MAVHTFRDYSNSINRFSPEYSDLLCHRALRARPLISSLLNSMRVPMMQLDMLKAYVYYDKPLHECLAAGLSSAKSRWSEADFMWDRETMFLHGLLGLLTECNELWLAYCADFSKLRDASSTAAIEEGGDVLWFLNELLKSCGVTMAEAAAVNEAKLSTRYGNAHDNARAIVRDKEAERRAMLAAREEAQNAMVNIAASPATAPVPASATASAPSPEPIQPVPAFPESSTSATSEKELKELLYAALPPLQDAAMHNASRSSRIAVARIREILNMPQILFKHGVNYDGSGQQITIGQKCLDGTIQSAQIVERNSGGDLSPHLDAGNS